MPLSLFGKLRSGIAGVSGNSVRRCQTVFPRGCIGVQCQQRYIRVPVAVDP